MTERTNGLEVPGRDLLESVDRTSSIPEAVTAGNRITYLSAPMPVNMGNWWFDIATIDHFWIRRRFHVMRRLADEVVRNAKSWAEIGCGNGLLQRDMEDHYGILVAGFDLNEVALQKNVSRSSPLYCYNIHERRAEFRGRYDLLFLFDVLEHIEDESEFLQSVGFHLAPGGSLLINVPAHQSFYSDYDRAAGHIRRYSINELTNVCERNGFRLRASTYWGLPLVPLLLVRKLMSMERSNGKAGLDTRGAAINKVLSWLAQGEPLPQKFLGTSVMAVLEKRT